MCTSAREDVPIRYGIVGGKDADSQPPRMLDRRRSSSEISADATKVKEYFISVSGRLRAQGITASRVIVTGPAASSIIEYCSDSDSSLIAMATHGWTGIGHENVGSVTEAVLDGAQTPVIVFRLLAEVAAGGDSAHISTLIVGLDDSLRAEGSLNLARLLARELSADMIVERSSGAALRFATPDAIAQAERRTTATLPGLSVDSQGLAEALRVSSGPGRQRLISWNWPASEVVR